MIFLLHANELLRSKQRGIKKALTGYHSTFHYTLDLDS